MADRIPLVVDSSNYRIEELPAGDALDLQATDLKNTSVVGCLTVTQSDGALGIVTLSHAGNLGPNVITGIGSVGINTTDAMAPLSVYPSRATVAGYVGPSTTGFSSVPVADGGRSGILMSYSNGQVGDGTTISPSPTWDPHNVGASIVGAYVFPGGTLGQNKDHAGLALGGGPTNNQGTWIALSGANRGDYQRNWIQMSTGVVNNHFDRFRIQDDGVIAMGSSLGIATDHYNRVLGVGYTNAATGGVGWGSTAFSRASGVVQIFARPDGVGDTENNTVVQADGGATIINTVGIASVPVFGSNVYTWKFQNQAGPNGFAKSLVGCLYNTGQSNGGTGHGAGFELGSNPQKTQGAWLSLGGAGRGDGQANIISIANGAAGSFAERIRILSNGNIGIGTSSAAQPVHLIGALRYEGRPAAAAVTALGVDATGIVRESSSSRRFKENIAPYEKGLSDVENLNPVTFNYIGEDVTLAGLIAEEVDEAGLGEYVLREENGDPKAINYGHMMALMTNAIKELKAENDALKARLDAAGF